jgi:hypothetical protein
VPRNPTPHDFWLHLRVHRPDLARRLDGVRGLERARGALLVRAPAGSWTLAEIEARLADLGREAGRFFGTEVPVRVEAGPADPEALPFPVLASKVWNHVAFWAWGEAGSVMVAVRKPRYLEHWLPAAAGADDAAAPAEDPEATVLREAKPDPSEALPALLDRLAALARASSSYAQLVAAFPGDAAADRLEARLYAAKEWGTPATPGPVFHKYVGRLHYVGPAAPPLGVRTARAALGRGRC